MSLLSTSLVFISIISIEFLLERGDTWDDVEAEAEVEAEVEEDEEADVLDKIE